MNDWKTTSAGILAILSAIISIVYAAVAGAVPAELLISAVTSILAGIGLIYAKDATSKP
jgi:hypothetical protein